jgi:hypothetical protein
MACLPFESEGNTFILILFSLLQDNKNPTETKIKKGEVQFMLVDGNNRHELMLSHPE